MNRKKRANLWQSNDHRTKRTREFYFHRSNIFHIFWHPPNRCKRWKLNAPPECNEWKWFIQPSSMHTNTLNALPNNSQMYGKKNCLCTNPIKCCCCRRRSRRPDMESLLLGRWHVNIIQSEIVVYAMPFASNHLNDEISRKNNNNKNDNKAVAVGRMSYYSKH